MVDAITQRRALPPGGSFALWPAADGARLRVAVWADGTRGTLLFLNGRADFIEKYAEALCWWRGRGWAIVSADWRGQGGSGRLGRTAAHGHADAFDLWVDDLRAIIGRAAALPAPLVAVGHSMGGHLLLRALAGGEARIGRAALTAPMLGIAAPWFTAPLARAATAAGFGARFAPGQAGGRAAAALARRVGALTSCAARGPDEEWWLSSHPELRLGGVTWGWLAAAARSIGALERPGTLEAVATPVHALLAADERVTANGAAMRALARLPAGSYEVIAGRHELLREADAPRLATMAAIDHFLERA